MSGRVTALTLCGVILIAGGLLIPRPAAAESNVLDDCLGEASDAALTACSAAIKANPNDAEAYQGRGSAYVRRGENERAIADYNAAIKISPEFGLPYFNRGLILESKSQLKEALSDFKRAAELDPTDDDSKEAVARVTAALARGPAPVASTTGSAPPSGRNGSLPSWPNKTSAPAAKTRGAAPALASTEPALPAKRRASAQPLPTRPIAPTAPALANSDPAPVAASEAPEPVAIREPAPPPPPASKQERWTFNGSAITNWISGLRRSPAPSSANPSALSGQKPPSDSVIEAQEYWNDQMALANGGSMGTRRIISLERLGELKSSGILSDQEFEREKRRILGE